MQLETEQPAAVTESRGTQPAKDNVSRWFRYCNGVSFVLAGLSTLGILVVVVLQIVSRLVGNPAPWTEEGTRFIFLWMIFLGIGIGFRKAESPRVTFVLNVLPAKIRKFISVWFYAVGSVGFFCFMFVTGVQLMLQELNTHEMGSALMIPMWVVGLSVPLGSFFGVVGVLESLIHHRRLLTGGDQ